jgi:hypothetical protein
MAGPVTEAPPRLPWTEIVGKVGAVSGLAAAWLFLTDWSFAYNYFYAFGIGVSSVELDSLILPLYGFLTVREFPILAGALLVVAVAAASRRWGVAIPADVGIAALAAGVVGIFAFGYVLGAWKAERVLYDLRARDYPGFRRAEIVVDAGWLADPRLAGLAEDLAAGCYRMIFDNAGSVYAFRPLRDLPALSPPVLVLDRGAITALRLRAESTSCAR